MDLVQYIHPMEVGNLIFSWCILRWVEDLTEKFLKLEGEWEIWSSEESFEAGRWKRDLELRREFWSWKVKERFGSWGESFEVGMLKWFGSWEEVGRWKRFGSWEGSFWSWKVKRDLELRRDFWSWKVKWDLEAEKRLLKLGVLKDIWKLRREFWSLKVKEILKLPEFFWSSLSLLRWGFQLVARSRHLL